MTKYTTGEMAKLCGVSVRTVQYYDTRGVLVPSALSEGGRRLYSEEDLRRMRIICFLREIGLPLDSIAQLMAEEDPGSVMELLLDQQEAALRSEIAERQAKLEKALGVRRALRGVERFSVDTLGDIAQGMKNRKQRLRMLHKMLAVGCVMDAIEIAVVVYGVKTGNWWPVLPGLAAVIALGVFISRAYFRNTVYICPACHAVFRPGLRAVFFARHTPNTRKLTCTSCGHKGFCVELYEKKA